MPPCLCKATRCMSMSLKPQRHLHNKETAQNVKIDERFLTQSSELHLSLSFVGFADCFGLGSDKSIESGEWNKAEIKLVELHGDRNPEKLLETWKCYNRQPNMSYSKHGKKKRKLRAGRAQALMHLFKTPSWFHAWKWQDDESQLPAGAAKQAK